MSCGLFTPPPASFSHQEGQARYYRLEGVSLVVPSISTVVGLVAKDGLRAWTLNRAIEHVRAALAPYVGRRLRPEVLGHALKEAARRPDGLAREAAIIGSAIHRAAQAIALGREPEGEAPADLAGLRRWLGEREGTTRHAEVVVACEHLAVAGSADLVGLLPDGRLSVADIKTSDRPYEAHFLQLAGYCACLHSMGFQVAEAHILLLPRAGAFRPVPLDDLERWAAAFELLAEAYHLLRPS